MLPVKAEHWDRVIRMDGATPVLVSGEAVLCRCRIKRRAAKDLILVDPLNTETVARIEDGSFCWRTEEVVDLYLPPSKAVIGQTVDFSLGAGRRDRQVWNENVTRVVVEAVLRTLFDEVS